MYTPLSLVFRWPARNAGKTATNKASHTMRTLSRVLFFFFLSSLFPFNVDVITTTDNNNNNNRFEAYKHKGEQLLGF